MPPPQGMLSRTRKRASAQTPNHSPQEKPRRSGPPGLIRCLGQKRRLVATATAAATVAAPTAATVTTAAAAFTAAAIAAAATAATRARTLFARTGFIDSQGAALEI